MLPFASVFKIGLPSLSVGFMGFPASSSFYIILPSASTIINGLPSLSFGAKTSPVSGFLGIILLLFLSTGTISSPDPFLGSATSWLLYTSVVMGYIGKPVFGSVGRTGLLFLFTIGI